MKQSNLQKKTNVYKDHVLSLTVSHLLQVYKQSNKQLSVVMLPGRICVAVLVFSVAC